MIENQKIRPAKVIGPLGEPLTLDSLPPPDKLPAWVRRVTGIERESGDATGPSVVATFEGIRKRIELPGPPSANLEPRQLLRLVTVAVVSAHSPPRR